jgi:hypothetical protein
MRISNTIHGTEGCMGLSTSGPTSKKGPVRKAFINILSAWSNQGEADEYKTKTYDDACFKYTCAIRYVQNQYQIIANAVAASWSSLSTLNLPWRGFANYERLSAIGSIWIDKPRLAWSIRLKNTPLNTRVRQRGGVRTAEGHTSQQGVCIGCVLNNDTKPCVRDWKVLTPQMQLNEKMNRTPNFYPTPSQCGHPRRDFPQSQWLSH